MYIHLNISLLLCIVLKSNGQLVVTRLLNQNRHDEAQQQARVIYEEFGNNAGYSGYFKVDADTDSKLFFWFFPSENDVASDPVVLCTQGGPGVSSLLSLFLQNGPYSIDADGTFGTRNHSWTRTNSLLYIDSPVNAGFSVTDSNATQSLADVTEYLMEAVDQFFKMFPNLRANNFYIIGESYGGKFVPSLGNKIHDHNKRVQNKINLKGVVIGNGFTDIKHQTGYGKFLYQLGFINNDLKATIEGYEKTIAESIDVGNWTAVKESFLTIYHTFQEVSGFTNVNNILDSIPPNIIYEEKLNIYLNQEKVQRALHVGTKPYTVFEIIHLTDHYQPVPEMIESLLKKEYKVLIYHGQFDFLIPHIATVAFLKELRFPGWEGYKSAPKRMWKINGKIAGYVKEAGNLFEVLVRNAGHMAAMDQSEWIYDLVDKFVHSRALYD